MTYPSSGALRIKTKYHWMSFGLALFSLKAIINGHPVNLRWGENDIPAPLGRHTIEIWVQYLWAFGRATITVDNTTHAPQVFYTAPVWNFQRGAIGLTEQRAPGLTGAWIFYAVLGLAAVACCVGILINAGNG